jgi:hypothetical protein
MPKPDERLGASGDETRRDWEIVQQDVDESKTERLKVRNGWLYRTIVQGSAVALVFVPGE